MAIIFVTTMIVASPNLKELFKGTLVPTIPKGSIFTVIAIIGTTVVPYNFFLYAASAKNNWSKPEKLELSKWDVYFSISMGGIITGAILITSATLMRGIDIKTAAGFSSAVATPLGASYTLTGLSGWEYNNNDKRFQYTNIIICILGILGSATGFNPISLISFSQALNGITLPIIVIYLVYVTSRKKLLREFTNNTFQNFVGSIIAIIHFS